MGHGADAPSAPAPADSNRADSAAERISVPGRPLTGVEVFAVFMAVTIMTMMVLVRFQKAGAPEWLLVASLYIALFFEFRIFWLLLDDQPPDKVHEYARVAYEMAAVFASGLMLEQETLHWPSLLVFSGLVCIFYRTWLKALEDLGVRGAWSGRPRKRG